MVTARAQRKQTEKLCQLSFELGVPIRALIPSLTDKIGSSRYVHRRAALPLKASMATRSLSPTEVDEH